jgi:hypothetical protein
VVSSDRFSTDLAELARRLDTFGQRALEGDPAVFEAAKPMWRASNGSLEFVTVEGSPAPVVRWIPVEAAFDDADGVTIHVLLHAVNGILNEFEIYREDSGPLQRALAPEEFRLLVL